MVMKVWVLKYIFLISEYCKHVLFSYLLKYLTFPSVLFIPSYIFQTPSGPPLPKSLPTSYWFRIPLCSKTFEAVFPFPNMLTFMLIRLLLFIRVSIKHSEPWWCLSKYCFQRSLKVFQRFSKAQSVLNHFVLNHIVISSSLIFLTVVNTKPQNKPANCMVMLLLW